ncbi:MAG: transcription elongation factor GreA [Armatimonadetes bacterium]|nr:transcription elongation factor GreA [Armatimonadota bacterium]
MQGTTEQEEEIILTPSGRKNIEDELNELIKVQRPEVADRIRDAKDYGDLNENAEYEAAKNAQAFIEGRIIDLKRIVGSARMLNESEIPTDTVGLGSIVTVCDEEFNEEWTVTMVSAYEADPDKDRISDISPVGHALFGRTVGDRVTVRTPGGNTNYTIQKITK